MAQGEMLLLIQWLRAHGMTPEEIIDCIEYIESGRNASK